MLNQPSENFGQLVVSIPEGNGELLDRIIDDIRNRVSLGKFDNLAKRQMFAGASVIVEYDTDKTRARRDSVHSDGFYGYNDQYVLSKYAVGISALFYELSDAFNPWLDYQNKYYFYGRLATAANEELKKGDTTAVFLAIIDEATKLRDEIKLSKN